MVVRRLCCCCCAAEVKPRVKRRAHNKYGHLRQRAQSNILLCYFSFLVKRPATDWPASDVCFCATGAAEATFRLAFEPMIAAYLPYLFVGLVGTAAPGLLNSSVPARSTTGGGISLRPQSKQVKSKSTVSRRSAPAAERRCCNTRTLASALQHGSSPPRRWQKQHIPVPLERT